MVSTFGNNIVSAFTGGQSVKAIYTYGEKVWPNEPSVYYMSWLPSDLSGSFTIGESTYNFEDYGGYFSDFSGAIPYHCFVGRNFTSIETNAFEIGYGAFYGCGSLLSANITNCSRIDESVFMICTSLRTVSLPKCTIIGEGGFNGCYSLSTIDLPNCSCLGSYAFFITGSIRRKRLNISCPKCESYGDHCFCGRRLDYPYKMDFTSCKYIGDYAFNGAIGMFMNPYPVYDFPNCSYIGSYAFDDCGIVNVKLSKIDFIAYMAFKYNYSLWDVHPTRRVSIYTSSVCLIEDKTVFYTLKNGEWQPGWEIYVPSSLVSAYKADSVWSYYSEHIHPITN